MELITGRELAKRANRSPQYINKIKKRVPPVVDFVVQGKTSSGKPKVKINADGKKTRAFIISCLEKGASEEKGVNPRQPKKSAPKPKKKKPAQAPVPESTDPETTEENHDEEITDFTPPVESLEKHIKRTVK